ncbi:innexin unc-9-like [Dreissena polymorpha]|nr:innexin unc-9-like [Dreissena polymorpha]
MVDAVLTEVKKRIKVITGHHTDDWIDRWSHMYTCLFLIIVAVIVSTVQVVGKPINCWLAAEYEKDWFKAYVESYCWISNTYHIAFFENLPVDIDKRKDRETTYYQWVPLILLLQAFMFKFPNVIWRLMHHYAGISLDGVVDLSQSTQCSSPKDCDNAIDRLAYLINKWLETQRNYKNNVYTRTRDRITGTFGCFCSKRGGTFLPGLFLLSKFLYVANAIGQFYLLNAFLAVSYNWYGFEVLEKLRSNTPWTNSPRFPLVTFCDFEIRHLQNIKRHTYQCVLPINLFNEKFFILLWFWFVVVAVLACCNFGQFLFTVNFKSNRQRFVKKYLDIGKNLYDEQFDKTVRTKFIDDYLREDGVFVLRMIASNSTDIVTTDLVKKLWDMFTSNKDDRKANDDL